MIRKCCGPDLLTSSTSSATHCVKACALTSYVILFLWHTLIDTLATHPFIAHIQLQWTLQTVSVIITCSPFHPDILLSSLPLSQLSGFFIFFPKSSHSSPHLCCRSRNHERSFQWLSLLGSFFFCGNTHIPTQIFFHYLFFCRFSSENFCLGVV